MLKIKKHWINFGWIILIILFVFALVVFFTNYWSSEPNNLGDSSGLANGLFSALAFGGVIFAIFLQREELELQREELKDTRLVMEQQKTEFHIQNETLKLQRFENTFFQMVTLHHEIVNGLNLSFWKPEFKYNPQLGRCDSEDILHEYKGRVVFEELYLTMPFKSDRKILNGLSSVIKEKGIKGYEDSFLVSLLDHYFRYLYRILKFIDESDLLKKESLEEEFTLRKTYSSLLRAQLSNFELVILYYNANSENGKEKFLPLLEKYAMFDNLRQDLLVQIDNT